jgi:hypothetical protein
MAPHKMDRNAIRKGTFIDIMSEGERLGLSTIANKSERRATFNQTLEARPKSGSI